MRNIWQVTRIRAYNVSGTSCKLLTSRKMLQRIRNVFQVIWRRGYNIPGTSFKLLEQDVTTCQDRLARYLQKIITTSKEGVASHLKKAFQRIRNIWQITARRVNNVSGTSCKLLTSKEKQDISMYVNMTSRGLCMCIRDTPKEHCHWITGWACPSPESPSVILKVSFQDAGPLNPPHVPAPCPHVPSTHPMSSSYINCNNI